MDSKSFFVMNGSKYSDPPTTGRIIPESLSHVKRLPGTVAQSRRSPGH
jgi:hypothetical protein